MPTSNAAVVLAAADGVRQRSGWLPVALAIGVIALIGAVSFWLPRVAPQVSATAVVRPAIVATQDRGPAAAAGASRDANTAPLASSAAASARSGDTSAAKAGTAMPVGHSLPSLSRTGATRGHARMALREEAPIVPTAVPPPEPMVPMPEVSAEATVPAPPPPPPDRWQSMQDRLAGCAREGGLAGVICDQRTRLASCEGYWGRVAQCALPPENPGGQ